MHLNWDLILRIAAPVLTLFLGIYLTKWTEDRPRLITYLSHTFAISSKTPDGRPINVHTHSIVVRNIGRKSATNVRLGHQVLPAFQIFPSLNYKIEDLPDGSKEIVLPLLVPKEQITINYLYFPPVVWSQINTYTKSDQGFAKTVNMMLTQQTSKQFRAFAAVLFLLGFISLGYLLVILVEALIRVL